MSLRDLARDLVAGGQVPFLIGAMNGGPRMSGTRILEALIIAAVSALASGYVTGRVLEERLLALHKDVQRIERRVDRQEQDLRNTREMMLRREGAQGR